MLQALPESAPLPGLERLAKEAGLTKHHFHRLFKRETGLTPREFALATRRESQSETSDSANMTPMTPITPFSNSTSTPLITDEELFVFPDADDMIMEELKKTSSADFGTFVVYYSIVETTYGLFLVAFHDHQICKLELGTNEA